MRELWWALRGSVRLRLTGADPERTLGHLCRTIRLEDIRACGPLVVEFSAAASDMNAVNALAERFGDRVEVLDRGGFPQTMENWLRYPLVCITVLVLICASLWLPGRVLFFQVEGNEHIPDRRILEEASSCGLHFGASRASVRSEQVKNRLLDALPELGWVGVNTSGCVATITVQERQRSPEEELLPPGNLVAAADGIITSVTVTAGTPQCVAGQGVRAGQTLISGYTDLGLCTHVEAAQGEIFALTERRMEAMLPGDTCQITGEGEIQKKYSLLLGKNRINFYSDSGILHTGCGKMTKIRVLTLPGGWELPVALIEEVYTVRQTAWTQRSQEEARSMLEQAARRELEQQMIAGEIQQAKAAYAEEEGRCRLTLLCRCHEMIGRRSSGIMTEGDIHDGETDERGAG